jgi:peroxiredoxin
LDTFADLISKFKTRMKKLLLIVAAFTVLISCNKAGENEYIVTGTIKGIADGKSVILEVQDETGQLKPIDTVKVEKGKFTFKGTAKEPDMHLINIETVQGKIPFILENGDIEMTINKDSINITKVTGTYNNEELNSYKEKGVAIQKKMMKFQKDNTAIMQAAQQKQDTAAMNKLRTEYSKFQDEFTTQSETYVSSHPKAFISALIIEGMFNQMAPDLKKIKTYYDGLDKSVKDTKHGKKIKKNLDSLLNPVATVAPIEIGTAAPDFSAPNPEGKMVSLKESKGKITIIDFWASWCKPCRQENPNMVALYKEFHAKGLNIVSVSLDEKAEEWKKAIASDKLTWTNISNLKDFQDPIAVQYSVKLIPSTFVIDAAGTVVAKDLRGAELKAKIASLLEK